MKKYFGKFASSGDVQTALEEETLKKPYVAYVEDGDYIDWNSIEHTDYSLMPLTFEVLTGGTIYWRHYNYGVSGDKRHTIQYSKNGGEWVSITSQTDKSASISLEDGDVIQFRGDNNTYHYVENGSESASYFEDENSREPVVKMNIKGNINSLLNSTDYSVPNLIQQKCFRSFFASMGFVNAENMVLPAKYLDIQAYALMFNKNPYLVTAPKRLPATTLGQKCYLEMFSWCVNLETGPFIEASHLGTQSCQEMFYNSQKVNYVKCLATDISALNCTSNWLDSVSGHAGTFVKKAGVSWPSGNSGIPTGWTVIEE